MATRGAEGALSTACRDGRQNGTMLIRVHKKSAPLRERNWDLIDILRNLSTHDAFSVVSRQWMVIDIETATYIGAEATYRDGVVRTAALGGADGDEGLGVLFPEASVFGSPGRVVVSGERLMERTAVLAYVEYGMFLRIRNVELDVTLPPDFRDRYGDPGFIAQNVDIEIRRCDLGPFEVAATDEGICRYLLKCYEDSEIC